MATSIRLKTETQQQVDDEVKTHFFETSVVISDAQMVDALVREALEARRLARVSMAAKRKGGR